MSKGSLSSGTQKGDAASSTSGSASSLRRVSAGTTIWCSVGAMRTRLICTACAETVAALGNGCRSPIQMTMKLYD